MTNEKKPIEKPSKKARNLAYLSISFILLAVIVMASNGIGVTHLIKMNTAIPHTYGAQLPSFQQYNGYTINITDILLGDNATTTLTQNLPNLLHYYNYYFGFGATEAHQYPTTPELQVSSNTLIGLLQQETYYVNGSDLSGANTISFIGNGGGVLSGTLIYHSIRAQILVGVNSTKQLNITPFAYSVYNSSNTILLNFSNSIVKSGYNNTLFVGFSAGSDSATISAYPTTNLTDYPNCHLVYQIGLNNYTMAVLYECLNVQKPFTAQVNNGITDLGITTFGISTPIPNTLSFTSTLLYLCSNGEVQQAYTPLNVSIISPTRVLNIPLQNSQITSISTAYFNSSDIEYGFSGLTNGALSISPTPFKNLPKIKVLMPDALMGYLGSNGSNDFADSYYFDSHLYNNYSYYWINNISATTLDLITTYTIKSTNDKVNSTAPLSNFLFTQPYYVTKSNGITGNSQGYEIPTTNSTINGSLPIFTTLQIAMPLSVYPLNVSDVIPKALNLTYFTYSYNKTIFDFTGVNGHKLDNNITTIPISKFNSYALTTINGIDYLAINVSLNVSYMINTTHRPIGQFVIANSGLALYNGSLAYSVANRTFSFTTTENSQNLTLALYRENSLYKPDNFTTIYYLNSAHQYVSNQSNYLWYFNSPVLYTDYFTAYVNSQPYTPYVKLLINKTNYSANSLTQNLIKTTLDSSTTTQINAYLYINGKYIKTNQIYFTTPAFNPCSAKTTYYNSLNFYYNASTNTISNVSIGHNTNSSTNKTAISTGGFTPPAQKVVSTGLGNAWFGISALGPFSFLLTNQLWYLVLMTALVGYFAVKMRHSAEIPIAILIVLFLGVGILTGLLNPLFSFGFAIMLGYFAFTTFRHVFVKSGA